MRLSELTRGVGAFLVSVALTGLIACGGNGSGSSTSPETGPGSTLTPSNQTPGPTPTPVEIIVPINGDIRAFARNAPSGATLIVSPGTYRAVEIKAGDLQGPITLFADTTGEITEGPAAPVVISGGGINDAALSISGQTDAVTIDGFTLVGGRVAALWVTDSSAVTVLDSSLKASRGDGVRFERSPGAFVLNNLMYNNAGSGIRILGSDSVSVINNTLYNNKSHGIYLSDSQGEASTNAFVENNIINKNTPTGITVDTFPPSSLDGYFGDFNLNTDGYGSDTPAGANDVNGPGRLSDPQFIFYDGADDFRLSETSPAINSGDFNTDPTIIDFLGTLTTQASSEFDIPPVDLGYHYVPAPTPTPTP